jgi:hypothetical protein
VRNKAKRLSALGATALVALVVIGPTAAFAQEETTTTGEATTTTLPEQKSVSGSKQSPNACKSHLDPQLAADGTPTIGVTVSGTAFGQPHENQPITLSNTKGTVSIPADLLQLGVDAGIIFDGQQIPSVVKFTIAGTGTTQKTHTYTVSATVTVHVTGGVAQPLSSTFNLPDTTWTPVSGSDVFFSEKSLFITSTIDLSNQIGVIVTATFNCTGNGATFIALGAFGPPGTTPTTAAPPATPAPSVTEAPLTTPTTPIGGGGGGTLPRTGSSAGLLLALAVGLLTAGLFALKATSRRSDVARSRNS